MQEAGGECSRTGESAGAEAPEWLGLSAEQKYSLPPVIC